MSAEAINMVRTCCHMRASGYIVRSEFISTRHPEFHTPHFLMVSATAAARAAEKLAVDPVEPAHHETHGEETTCRHDHDEQRFCGQDLGAPERSFSQKLPEHAEKHQGKEKTDSHSYPVNKGRQEFVLAREHLRPGKNNGKGDDEHDIETHFLVYRPLVGRHDQVYHRNPGGGNKYIRGNTYFRVDKVPQERNRHIRHRHDEQDGDTHQESVFHSA